MQLDTSQLHSVTSHVKFTETIIIIQLSISQTPLFETIQKLSEKPDHESIGWDGTNAALTGIDGKIVGKGDNGAWRRRTKRSAEAESLMEG